MNISSTQQPTFVSTSSKKRKCHEIGESIIDETFIAALLDNKIEIVGRELSKSVGSEMAIHKKVKDLFGALCEIDSLTEDELDITLSIMPNHPTQMIVFFSLSSTRRLRWIRRFIANNC